MIEHTELGDVDFGRTADDYAQHRAGFPPELFARLDAQHGVGRAGQELVDLGCGTGTLARGFARRGARVTGVDAAPAMLAEAARLDAAAGVTVRYVSARAEATGLASAAFDVVSCGQAWHWFDAALAFPEARRILKPGGAFVLAYFDWIALAGSVADATESLVEKHNPAWNFRGWAENNLRHLSAVAAAGFASREAFAFDVDVRYTHEAWRGRMRASSGIAASLTPDRVAAFDADLAALLRERYPADPLTIPHRVFAVVAR
jgi:SAM-dependent methyltransferase